MKFTICIPSFNNWKLTHSLLFDIYNNFPQDVDVLVVDDCSPDAEVLQGLAWWQTGMLKGRLHTIINKENLGFLRSSNLGVSLAMGDVVMLISTDVRISDKSIVPKLEEIFSKAEVPTLVGNRLLDYDTGWNTIENVIYPYLEGYFLVFKKSEWDEFGGFDERYAPSDFEDVCLSVTYSKNGGQLISLLNEKIVHIGAQSYGYTEERRNRTERNKKLFEEKWKK